MNNKKKICVVTGTRAEYGLLYWLLKEFKKSKKINHYLIATGMHLSPEFGLTVKQIKADGFKLYREIEILISSDSPSAVAKSCGMGIISFADVFKELKPDILILLGDRFELLAVASAALIFNIPIAHIHGGEITQGAYDDAIRHSISKMSWTHFVAHSTYKRRLIQLGENKNKIFNFGGLGAYGINQLNLLSKIDLEKSINFKIDKNLILVTFHPITFEKNSSSQFQSLLNYLNKNKKFRVLFTMPNADNYGRDIINKIKNFVKLNPERSIWFYSLGQVRYLSVVKYSLAVVGNSSSGILEVPSFRTATINIGSRQYGRVLAKSVINCTGNYNSIAAAFKN